MWGASRERQSQPCRSSHPHPHLHPVLLQAWNNSTDSRRLHWCCREQNLGHWLETVGWYVGFFAVKLRWKWAALTAPQLCGVAGIYSCRALLVSLGLKGILIQSEGKQASKWDSKQSPLHLSSVSSPYRASFSSQWEQCQSEIVHRITMVWFGRDIKDHFVRLLAIVRVTFH